MFKQIIKPNGGVEEGEEEFFPISEYSSLNISKSSYTQVFEEDESFAHEPTEKDFDERACSTHSKKLRKDSIAQLHPISEENHNIQLNRSLSDEYLNNVATIENLKNKVNENSKLVKIDNKNSTSSLSIMKEAYGEYIEPQDHIEFANMSQSPEDEQKDSPESNYYVKNQINSPDEVDEQKIKEIDESLKDLNAFIQNKIKKVEHKTPDKCQSQHLNCSQSQNHFNMKKESQDL